jgi:hypothetical protein
MRIIFASIVAVALSLSASAVLADGGDTTQIHACAAKDGTMRIVSATTACKNNETALHWATTARVSAIETKNTAQDTSITSIQTKNTQQDTAITALQGQSGSSGSLLAITDSTGKLVGKTFAGALVKIGNDWFGAQFATNGFRTTSPPSIPFVHTTTDCTGPRYLDAIDPAFGDFIIASLRALSNEVAVFPTTPRQTVTYQSLEIVSLTGAGVSDLSQPGLCLGPNDGIFPEPRYVGQISTVTLTDLGLTPPFHLE